MLGQFRSAPTVEKTQLPASWRYLTKGYDTIQEAWDYRLHEAMETELDELRAKAENMADDGSGLSSFKVNREILQVRSTGALGGFRWVFGNDDFLILAKRSTCKWCISVRYLSAGLYEHGYDDLSERVMEILDTIGQRGSEDFCRLSRVDVAFDFHAPGFAEIATPRLAEAVLMPARCKSRSVIVTDYEAARKAAAREAKEHKINAWGRGGKLETLTLGSKASLQLELYNKSLEITEASGKEWLYAVWEESGLPGGIRQDVWRLEARMSGEWLKDRNIRRWSEFIAEKPALLQEALLSRRLTVPVETDSNRARWPLHPFWSEAVIECPAPSWTPRGRYVTGRRAALEAQAVKALSGYVMATGALIYPGAVTLSRDDLAPLAERVLDDAVRDAQRMERVLERAQERYRTVEDAR